MQGKNTDREAGATQVDYKFLARSCCRFLPVLTRQFWFGESRLRLYECLIDYSVVLIELPRNI